MKLLSVTLLAALTFTGLQATPISVDALNGGAPTGVSKVNFDSLVNGSTNYVVNSDLTLVVGSNNAYTGVVSGAQSGKYAAPFLSGSNGLGFGSPNQPDGADMTKYLSANPTGSVTLVFSSLQKYFGLLWGSVDKYNTLSFYNGAALVGSVTGRNVWGSANGDQGANGTFYVNINSTQAFDKVVASSTGYAFEFDNVAYDKRTHVPDTASTLALAGLGLVGLAAFRRRR